MQHILLVCDHYVTEIRIDSEKDVTYTGQKEHETNTGVGQLKDILHICVSGFKVLHMPHSLLSQVKLSISPSQFTTRSRG